MARDSVAGNATDQQAAHTTSRQREPATWASSKQSVSISATRVEVLRYDTEGWWTSNPRAMHIFSTYRLNTLNKTLESKDQAWFWKLFHGWYDEHAFTAFWAKYQPSSTRDNTRDSGQQTGLLLEYPATNALAKRGSTLAAPQSLFAEAFMHSKCNPSFKQEVPMIFYEPSIRSKKCDNALSSIEHGLFFFRGYCSSLSPWIIPVWAKVDSKLHWRGKKKCSDFEQEASPWVSASRTIVTSAER